MAKKKYEHGPLYLHAKRELELIGLENPKGPTEVSVSSTVLRLIDTIERGTANEFQRNAALDVFDSLARGMVVSEITDNPDEWEPAPTIGEGVMVNKRCNLFFSPDNGATWRRGDNNATGISKKVKHLEKETSDGNETQKDVQLDKSE